MPAPKKPNEREQREAARMSAEVADATRALSIAPGGSVTAGYIGTLDLGDAQERASKFITSRFVPAPRAPAKLRSVAA